MIEITHLDVMASLSAATEKTNMYYGIKIVGYAKLLAPWKTGRLRNAIMWKTHQHTGGFNDSGGIHAELQIDVETDEKSAFVGLNLHYGPYREFGTRNMAPQPFMRPSIALTAGADQNEIAKKIEAEVKLGKLKHGIPRTVFF